MLYLLKLLQKKTSGINDLFIEISKKYTGSDSASIIEENDEVEEYRKIRKESVIITKESQKKDTKKKGCC